MILFIVSRAHSIRIFCVLEKGLVTCEQCNLSTKCDSIDSVVLYSQDDSVFNTTELFIKFENIVELKIQSLFGSKDLLSKFTKNAEKISSFDASGCRIESLQNEEFLRAPNLTYLYLSRNEITKIGTTAFNKLHKLQVLHLDHNEIRELDSETFYHLPDLGRIFLQHNDIVTLPDNLFQKNQNLQQIDLSHNKIFQINESFKKFKLVMINNNYMDDFLWAQSKCTSNETVAATIGQLEKEIKDLQANYKPGNKTITTLLIGICVIVNIITIVKIFIK